MRQTELATNRRQLRDHKHNRDLPTGETCGDCQHVNRCLVLGYTGARSRQTCDFWPIKFMPFKRGV